MTYSTLRRAGLARILTAVALLAFTVRPAAAGIVSCPADCNDDHNVTVNELVLAVTIALGDSPLSSCPAADRSGDGEVSIDDLLAAVSAALNGCPAEATPTLTASATATGSQPPTATATQTNPLLDTPTRTATATATAISTATPTGRLTEVPTATAPPTPTGAVATATHTAGATATHTAVATETEVESTATHTPIATATPSAADTPTPTPTVSATPSVGPSDLHAMIDGTEVRLAWNSAPPEAGYTNAKLLRRLNAPVDGPSDPLASEVYFGPASSATHPLAELLPDVPEQTRVYHYAVFGCDDAGGCGSVGAATTLTPTLPQALRGGGYVLHWRYAHSDVCEDDTALGTAANPIVPNWWKSCETGCATASQLDDLGRAQASTVGQAFDILGIPVGRVLASEFCRAQTTAALMDFGPPVEGEPDVTYFVYDEAQRCADSYALLSDAPAPGSNTAIIGHTGFTPPCPVLSQLGAAEAAVFKPNGQGGTTFVTRVGFDEWASYLPPGPSALSASLDEPHVRLTWVEGPAYPVSRLLRRLNAPVEGPEDPDAQVVYVGTGNTVLEPLTNLLPSTPQTPRVYYYAVYGCVGASCETQGSATMFQPTIAQALRAGGYNIHWRHSSATVCEDQLGLGTAATTTSPNWWKSCDATCPTGGTITATARQLSDIGRAEATSIGEQFDARGFPIGRVISSEFCRNRETAELMDFGPPIEQSPAITYFVYDEANRCANTFALLAERPSSGTNTALIGHAGNNCPPLSDLAWSQAAIYKPDGAGGATFIATVNVSGWAGLP